MHGLKLIEFPHRLTIGHFRAAQSLFFKARLSTKPLISKMIFHSHANKTHFHNKGFVLRLVLKVRIFVTREWPIAKPVTYREHLLKGLIEDLQYVEEYLNTPHTRALIMS